MLWTTINKRTIFNLNFRAMVIIEKNGRTMEVTEAAASIAKHYGWHLLAKPKVLMKSTPPNEVLERLEAEAPKEVKDAVKGVGVKGEAKKAKK